MKRLLTENRVGIVRVSRRWFEDGTAVPMLMNRLMVCRCEFLYTATTRSSIALTPQTSTLYRSPHSRRRTLQSSRRPS
jgi:hypothetical protein